MAYEVSFGSLYNFSSMNVCSHALCVIYKQRVPLLGSSDLSVELVPVREELRCAIVVSGAQSVMMDGMIKMQRWSAARWELELMVCHIFCEIDDEQLVYMAIFGYC